MNANAFELFREGFPDDRDRTFVEVADGERRSYRDLEIACGRYASALAGCGARPGDRIVALVENGFAAIALYLACLRAGLVFVPLNPDYRPSELRFFLADADPRVVVASPAALARVQEASRDGSTPVLVLAAEGRGSLAELADRAGPAPAVARREGRDAALLVYTSGTTGVPRGAMLGHGLIAAKGQILARHWGWSAGDVLLHVMPLFHTHGLLMSMSAVLLRGASMILLPKFEADAVMRALPRATVFTGVPTMYARLVAHGALSRAACRSMRLFVSGSAPLHPEISYLFELATGHRIVECFGMTETQTLASNPLMGERRAGSVGRPLPGVETRIVDAAGAPLRPGRPGVLEVRSEHLFAGYWRDPEKTRAAFRPDGFFITGDVASVDEAGYLSIVGRSKEVIITGGYNVYPREIELALESLPDVAVAAVFGLPHPDFGEGVTAAVELRGHAPPATEAVLLDAMKRRLVRYKVPKRILLTDRLPRNAIGKIVKGRLRAAYSDLYQSAGG